MTSAYNLRIRNVYVVNHLAKRIMYQHQHIKDLLYSHNPIYAANLKECAALVHTSGAAHLSNRVHAESRPPYIRSSHSQLSRHHGPNCTATWTVICNYHLLQRERNRKYQLCLRNFVYTVRVVSFITIPFRFTKNDEMATARTILRKQCLPFRFVWFCFIPA